MDFMPADFSHAANIPKDPAPTQSTTQVFILSGGMGSSGEQLVRTVIAQFPDANLSVEIFPKVYTRDQVQEILGEAVKSDAVVVHTFVDPDLRGYVMKVSQDIGLSAIDLVGPLIGQLVEKIHQVPLGKPGLYRQLYQSYFDRIRAMDYMLDHDDGKNPEGWRDAEIILLGASRVGKTPLSLYLSVLGWQVANVPLVADISPRKELFELDRNRLVGLTIAPAELIEHRKHRQRNLGVAGSPSSYVDPEKIFEELQTIEVFYRRHRISVVDVTGKPIETTADEIIRRVRRNFSSRKLD
jgi:regulator of PEP synthase PpsR (kinase-PPPase family)